TATAVCSGTEGIHSIRASTISATGSTEATVRCSGLSGSRSEVIASSVPCRAPSFASPDSRSVMVSSSGAVISTAIARPFLLGPDVGPSELPFSVIDGREGQRRFRMHRGVAQAASRAHPLPPPGPGTYAVPMTTDAQRNSGSSGPADGDGSARARILADVAALRDSFDAGTTRPVHARLAQLEALRRGLR